MKAMKFFRVWSSDLRRLFRSTEFWFSILMVSFLAFLGISSRLQEATSLSYLIPGRYATGACAMGIMVVCVLPYGLSYREDMKRNYIHCLISRAGACCYGWSHILTAAVGAFLAVLAGYLLCYGLLSIRIPLLTQDVLDSLHYSLDMGGELDAYSRVLLSGRPVMYLVCVFATEAMGYAFLAVSALLLSVKVENPFLLLSIPAFMYYGNLLLCDLLDLPLVFRFHVVLTNGGIFRQNISDIWIVMLAVLIYFGCLIGLEGVLFTRAAGRRKRIG